MSNNILPFSRQEILPPLSAAHNRIINLWRWAAHIESDVKGISETSVRDLRDVQIETMEFGFVPGIKSIEHLSEYVANLATALRHIAEDNRQKAMLMDRREY